MPGEIEPRAAGELSCVMWCFHFLVRAIRKSALKNEFDLCDFVGYGHHDFNLKKLERLFFKWFFFSCYV